MISPLHAALEVVAAEPVYELRQATVRAMLYGYDHRWADTRNDWRIHRVEEFVSSPLFNPATGAKSRTFINAGIVDVDLEDDRGHGIMDHKTTSDEIEDPGGTYWQQLIVESQLDHYLLLKHLNGERTNWAVWDVMRKPGIRPRALTKAEIKELEGNGNYCGIAMRNNDVAAALAISRETLPLYEARLMQECIENTQRYFQRRRITRLGDEVLTYAEELWDNGQEFISARRTERRPRNSGACMNYGRACTYLPICSGHDSIYSGNWRKKEFIHSELPIFDDGQGGRSILTNSRIRTFQTCRRKEQYAYELGIERNDPDEVETLAFGTLWHKALAAYFTTIQENQHGISTSGDASQDAPAAVGV